MASEAVSTFQDGTVPTAHQLRSALRVGRLIDRGGAAIAALRSSYRLVPYGGLYRAVDLGVGEQILLASGLVVEADGTFVPAPGLLEIANSSDRDGCEVVLAALLQNRTPLWLLAAAAEDVLAGELIPDEERQRLDGILDPEARDAFLMAMGRRYSDQDRSATGVQAEEAIVAACKTELRDAGASDLAVFVRRVSEVSDQLGYDITAPRLDRTTRRLEVKGTRVPGSSVIFYLSRNEAARGLIDSDWSLVVCRVAVDAKVHLIGHVSGAKLRPYLPVNPGPETRWESSRMELPESLFAPGLPAI